MLKQRIITALFLFAGFAASVFLLPSTYFSMFALAVVFVGALEWSNLAGLHLALHKALYVVSTLLLAIAIGFYAGFFPSLEVDVTVLRSLLLVAAVWWCIALLWVQGYPTSQILWAHKIVQLLMGWLVLIPCWLGLSFLHSLEDGRWLIVLVVMIVICADTGAYGFGSRWGKRKLAPNVSPGKSWEGFLGGVFCCLVLAVIVAVIDSDTPWSVSAAVILPAALVSTLGDLLESMMKRSRGIKDSGKILPGHGGLLDRIDSLTATVPIFTLGLLISGWHL